MQSKNKNQIGITALYCRLSRDDGTESESIAEILSISKHIPSHLKTKQDMKTPKKIGLYSRM